MAASKDDPLVIGGLNVRSLLKKNDGGNVTKDLVEKLIRENKLDILVVGESMLRESTTPRRQGITSDPLHIDDFVYVRQDRYFINKNASGGLIVYIREDIEFKKRSDWEWYENNVQFLEISITEPIRVDLVAIYSPNEKQCPYVINLMRFFLERNKELHIPVMFVGDLNIDPVKSIDKDVKAAFKGFEDQFGARRLIKDETHIMKNCIDHIIIAIPEQDMGSVDAKVVKTVRKSDDSQYISDHQLVLCSVKKSPQPATFSISQPKECDDINLQVVLSNLIKDSQTIHISLKMIYEFNGEVETRPACFNFKIEAPNKVVERLAQIDTAITVIKDNHGQVRVVTTQCTICIVHKQTKSLHISDESKPWSVGGVDCFLINCSADQIPSVEPFLHKFHVCDQQSCLMLYNSEENLKHHKKQHGCCPYCECIENSTELNQHIKVKHKYRCDREDCMKVFIDDTKLKEHKNTHPKHVDLNSDDNKCVLCDTSYDNQEQLTYHYASKHFICIQCSKQLSSKQSTVNHLKTKHSITWCPDKCCRKYFGPNDDICTH